MKLVISLFLVMTLNTGCGVLKHSKATAKTQAASDSENKEITPNTSPLDSIAFENTLPAPSPWQSTAGESYMVLAMIPSESAKSLLETQDAEVTPAGTLSATAYSKVWNKETDDSEPKFVESTGQIEFNQIQVYFAQTFSGERKSMVAVKIEDYAAISQKYNSHTVWYDPGPGFSRLELTRSSMVSYGVFSTPYSFFDGETIVGNCDKYLVCTYHQDHPSQDITTTYGALTSMFGIFQKYGNITVYQKQETKTDVTNIQNYELHLNGSFNRTAAKLVFKPAAQN